MLTSRLQSTGRRQALGLGQEHAAVVVLEVEEGQRIATALGSAGS